MVFALNSYTELPCPPDVRAALIVGHPGHELRIHGWLESVRPTVFVPTDGSGRTGCSRLESTKHIVTQANAECGNVFGRFADAELYEMLLCKEHQRLIELAEELALQLASKKINFILGDSAEGYNPSHDLCRLLIDAAVSQLEYPVTNLAFPLVDAPDAARRYGSNTVYRYDLDDLAFARKMFAAESYHELASEFENAISRYGREPFRQEFFATSDESAFSYGCAANPWYEEYGAAQVRAGHYQHAIQYREHMLPLAQALKQPIRVVA